MSASLLRRAVLALGLAALVTPAAARAQTREVVSKEVSVGRSEATLRLEFSDDSSLEISFDDGDVVVNGDIVGSFERGGELDAAWRELLGQAVSLDDGALSEMLADWTVPADLAGDVADIARDIDQALEDALRQVDVRVDADGGRVSISIGDRSALVDVLRGSLGRLGILGDALQGLDADARIHLDEDGVVPAGTVLEGTLVVIGGTARIEGEVDGDVVVVGGSLDIAEGGRVTGEVRIADTRVVRNEGTVRRGVVDVLEHERDFESQLRTRLRGEIEAEVRDEVRDEMRSEMRSEVREGGRDGGAFSVMAPFRSVAQAVGGVAGNLVTILVLGLLGAVALAFAGEKVDVIAETARRAPGRAAMVGFAGTILLLPVWILGTVALAVSIIFIPVAIAWLPLFPIAACFAALVGYLAVARNTGEWLADSEFPWTGWIRRSNPWVTLVGGLVGLMLAFIAAHVVAIVPFLHFLSALLVAAGSVITVVAVQVGFGAVLLTRAGRRREYWSAFDPDAAWEAAMSVDVDDEPAPSTTGRTKKGGGEATAGEVDDA